MGGLCRVRRLTGRHLSCSERVHGHQEEVPLPLLQLLGHAPVHPQEAHALPHGRAALPLRDLREEVHAARAHEAAHAGERAQGRVGVACGQWGVGVGQHRGHHGVSVGSAQGRSRARSAWGCGVRAGWGHGLSRMPREALKWGPPCGGKDQDSREAPQPHIPPEQLCPRPQVQKAGEHISPQSHSSASPLGPPLLQPGLCRCSLPCQDPAPAPRLLPRGHFLRAPPCNCRGTLAPLPCSPWKVLKAWLAAQEQVLRR